MRTTRKALLYISMLVCLGLFTSSPAHAQDCSWTFVFTTNGTSPAHANLSSVGSTPCVAHRVTYSSTGTLSAVLTFQTSPTNVSYTAVPNTICSSTVQPPCLTDGANPTANNPTGSLAARVYDGYTQVVISGATGTGTGTVTVYGYKGTSASAGTGAGGGSVSSVTISGAANQLTTSGTCTGTTIINCNLKFLNAAVTWTSGGDLTTPGSLTTGSGSGTSGSVTLSGSSSGSASIQAAATQGTPNPIQLPTSTASASGAALVSDGASPQQTSWAAPAGTGALVVKTAALGTSGNCMQWSAAGAADAGAACGSGGGGGSAGSTLFSTTGSTTVTATSATTLLGSVTGSKTIPANTFTAGQFFEVFAEGYYSTPATPASLTIDLLIGGSVRITTGAVVQIASVTTGTWRLNCGVTTRTSGGSGTQIANCVFEATGATITPGESAMQTSSTWAMDTTATQVVDLQATWSTATGSPTITCSNAVALIPGSASPSFSSITSGTNTAAAMVVGAGASIEPSSTGIIAQSTGRVPGSASSSNITNLPVGGWTIRSSAVFNDFTPSAYTVHIKSNSTPTLAGITRSLMVPYTLYVDMDCNPIQNIDSMLCGVYLTDGTKYEGVTTLSSNSVGDLQLRVETWTLLTGGTVTALSGATTNIVTHHLSVKITNDSSTRTFWYWSNGAWVSFKAEAAGTFLTETGAGPMGAAINAAVGDWLDFSLYAWSAQ